MRLVAFAPVLCYLLVVFNNNNNNYKCNIIHTDASAIQIIEKLYKSYAFIHKTINPLALELLTSFEARKYLYVILLMLNKDKTCL